MVDVRLLYPSDKYEPAVRLAEAIAAAGYTVEREALAGSGGFPRLAAEAGKAKVLILIWSRGLVTAAMGSAGVAEARRHPNLVEVSVDGIEPSFGGEGSPVVLLCGWRGQPFHPGWQRILADLKRLSGPREVPVKKAGAVPSGAQGPSRAGAARRWAPGRPGLRAAVAAGALIAATLGAATALEWRTPGATAAADTRPASPAGPPPAAAEAAGTVAAAPVVAAAATSPVSALSTAPVPASAAAPEPAAGRAGARKAAATQRSSPRRLAAAPRPEVKRYSRKHSKTMRLFCQRSGRSTPQCRTFVRSMRDLDG